MQNAELVLFVHEPLVYVICACSTLALIRIESENPRRPELYRIMKEPSLCVLRGEGEGEGEGEEMEEPAGGWLVKRIFYFYYSRVHARGRGEKDRAVVGVKKASV